MAALRLPDIIRKPLPEHSELDLALLRSRARAADGAAGAVSSTWAPRNDRASGRPRGLDIDDFTFGGQPVSKKCAPARRRPTQRQPIDDETTVPAEVYQQMLRRGAEVRGQMQHNIAFQDPSGKPYLRHHNSLAIAAEAEAAASMAAKPAPKVPAFPQLPSRPASACASEVAAASSSSWRGLEPLPVQVQ
eukprot:gnl/TRDRNA2_/TRDRNA2_50554_c0_seq1.p1 gnl/TRDRNA2_/TRDRNA2_50554_c0~~gnl/TRDRNA2_/TRDRNA2_50554_c0_seq1.p1  ORF type:complete len:190 (+),score=33.83 gnl/TRDRNA2_/TRDRNA2_50554_c0_seq1:44-613(+)